jgi:putative MATE family efflux protein
MQLQSSRQTGESQSSPLKNLLKTSLPAVVDLSSQTVMWTIEAILIGRLSAAAFGGVGMAIQVILVTMTVLLTFVVGASLIINRSLGASEPREANHIFAQVVLLGLAFSLFFGLLWYFGATQIFKLIKEGGADDAERAGVVYLKTLACFAPFFVTNFIALGVIRGVGDTKYSMMVNVGLNLVNVILAPSFIFGHFGFPRLEVQGAALAAGIAHTCGFAATFYLLRSRKTTLYLSFHEFAQPNWTTIKRLFKTGLPTTVEQLVWAFGQLVVTSYVAVLGVTLLAAHQVFMRIQAILSMLYMGFGMGAMTLMGKNLGAEQRSLAQRTAEISSWVMYAMVMLILLALFVFSQFIMRVFTTDNEVIKIGAFAIYAFAITQVPKALNNVLAGNLRGAGDLKWLMWLVIAGVFVLEIGLNSVIAFGVNWEKLWWALIGIWVVQTLDETIRLSANYWRFRGGKWKFLEI